MAVDLSIIIVNWKSLNYLRACIASIHRCTRQVTYEVIVVDNASGDGCEDVMRREFPGVLFFQSNENLGFARANNWGFIHSSGDLVVFLNPDTELLDDALSRMADHLRRNPVAGAVGARLLNTDRSLQTTCIQAFPTIWNQFLDSDALRRLFPNWKIWGMQSLYMNNGEYAEVEAISGACFMTRRQVFEEVNMFTDTYFMYVEDVDLSYKVFHACHRLHYLPDCELVHHGGRSSESQTSHFANLCQKQSLFQFFARTKGPFYARLYQVAIASSALVRLALVFLSFALGPFAFRGRQRRFVLQKWSAMFNWAIGRGVS